MTLKNTYLEPRYVLLVPETREGHEKRLLEKGVYTTEQVELTLKRAEFYAQFNRQHPGFFDTIVSSGIDYYNHFGFDFAVHVSAIYLLAFSTGHQQRHLPVWPGKVMAVVMVTVISKRFLVDLCATTCMSTEIILTEMAVKTIAFPHIHSHCCHCVG